MSYCFLPGVCPRLCPGVNLLAVQLPIVSFQDGLWAANPPLARDGRFPGCCSAIQLNLTARPNFFGFGLDCVFQVKGIVKVPQVENGSNRRHFSRG